MNSKKTLLVLSVGIVVGGIAVASISSLVKPAIAQDGSNRQSFQLMSQLSTENLDTLRGLDRSFASLAEYVAPTVVNITAEGTGGQDMMGRRMGAVSGVGTGVIFRADGWIITNDHVVNGFNNVTVTLSDGREFKGKVSQVSESDIAVVKIDATGLTAASFADSSKVKPGQFAMAVGSPFGLENTVTFGHVSALGRQNAIPDARVMNDTRFYPDLIQTDAPINQGNSGGPLFNIDGQVIGINTAIASTTGGSNGVGFAIPANLAKTLAETLITKGKVTRSALGLSPVDLPPYRKTELKVDGGALVENVEPGSPADKAGIKKDDVIVRIDNTPVTRQMDVRLMMYKIPAGQKVNVEVIRGGERKSFSVAPFSTDDLQALIRKNDPRQAPTAQNPQSNNQDLFDRIPNIEDLFERNRNDRGDDTTPSTPRTGPARLGVGVSDLSEQNRKTYGIPSTAKGALVGTVEPGSVAEKIGIEPGTVIESLNGKSVQTSSDVVEAMKSVKWGDRIKIKYSQFSASGSSSVERDIVVR